MLHTNVVALVFNLTCMPIVSFMLSCSKTARNTYNLYRYNQIPNPFSASVYVTSNILYLVYMCVLTLHSIFVSNIKYLKYMCLCGRALALMFELIFDFGMYYIWFNLWIFKDAVGILRLRHRMSMWMIHVIIAISSYIPIIVTC